MLAFHNDPELKTKYQSRLAAHHAADDIIRGEYGEAGGKSGWRGCAVGCTLHSKNHKNAEAEIGVPEALMQLDDMLFENLPPEDSPQWAVDFLNVIPVGADLSLVASKFILWVLSDPQFGSRQFADAAGQSVTDTVIALYRRRLAGDEPAKEDWDTVQANTYAAAYDARGAAYDAYDAAYDARAAAYAAAYAAHGAYDAYDGCTAAYAATRAACGANVNAFWQSAKNTLLQLLKDAPVPAKE